ncbi:hypothetical protein [Novosphingobium sp. PhB165]|uniref:hypothetical protein n=1 Tax=Novosphingobium sp. PhB165 TaxID=2485105 RepID=UPI001050948F|nr:hypothetical protein [Novosphingobium sp. PhB165]
MTAAAGFDKRRAVLDSRKGAKAQRGHPAPQAPFLISIEAMNEGSAASPQARPLRAFAPLRESIPS